MKKTKKHPRKKATAKVKAKPMWYFLDLGPVPTLAERCIRLATRLKTAVNKGVEPQPLSSNECLQAAALLDMYSKTDAARRLTRFPTPTPRSRK